MRTTIYVLKYLAFAAVGGFQLLNPSIAVRADAGNLFYVWAISLLVGGLLAAVGAIGDWWLPEMSAQGLLAFPFLFWAQVVSSGNSPSRWAFVSLCVGITLGALARAIEVWWVAHYPRGLR